jgi:dihydroorotate dehydrogenase (NAD+) catalytic subunit
MTPAEARAQQGEDKVDLAVSLGPLRLRHPIMNASGTFDLLEIDARYERDFVADFPFSAYVPKTVTHEARAGNPPPRVGETACGMINAIGLANPGLESFLDGLRSLAGLREPLLVSVGGSRREDYAAVVEALEETLGSASPESVPHVAGYELNVSCPNVRTGCQSIGTDQAETAALVSAIRPLTSRFIVVKLTPNVTDVVAVALRRVHDVAAALPVPVIGMGGIATGLDALEFIACGATAVAVGAANFAAVDAGERIVAELQAELRARRLPSVTAARGLALPTLPDAARDT